MFEKTKKAVFVFLKPKIDFLMPKAKRIAVTLRKPTLILLGVIIALVVVIPPMAALY